MQQKKKVRFIINPVSGDKQSENKEKIIHDNLNHDLYEYECSYTKGKGHATQLSSEAVKLGHDIVVACGGDGTVNEVANGLRGSQVPLGIIPGGSGNGFAMYIGMGRNTAQAVRKLNSVEIRAIDTCTVNDIFFINLAGVGFDALIAYKAENEKKRGLKMYVNLVTKEMVRFKAENFKVIYDGESIEGAFTTIAIANAPMYGYNFTVAPQAELSDGLFDIIFIKEASILRTLSTSWRMLNKTIDKSSIVEVRKAKSVKVISQRPYYFHVDGESFEFTDTLEFTMDPLSLNVLFPI
jgi:YegS/Rv2252/BmrU family lipid kinase